MNNETAPITMAATSLPARPGLPPLPMATDGRHRSWIIAASEPGFAYDGEEYPIDQGWITAQIEAFEALTDRGYLPPVLAEHQRDGTRLGDIEALALYEDPTDGRSKLIAAVSWAIEGAQAMIEAGRLRYASPAFSSLTDERGREFPFVLVEISAVSSPHQKGIGEVHILNTEGGGTMPATPNEAIEATTPQGPPAALEEDTEQEDETSKIMDVLKVLDTLSERIEAIEARIATMPEDEEEAPAPEEEEEEEDKPAEMAEAQALKARITQLEDERDRDRFALNHRDLLCKMNEGDREHAFKAYQTAPNGFKVLAGLITPTDASGPPQGALAARSWGVRLGETSSLDEDTKEATREDLRDQAMREAGGDAHKALGIYKQLIKTLN